ncbi:uncharacterized protein BDR25DRAFT_397159 [Lindgomyces ingoldianus]|uniref:Uncharacterized protein n=1 Tax=Lindgomyces ingoldianus TaxID=673940 RepID=A0ACB6Q981_9PLEO|nr:uncharacterized protein BDR25DRAFT_397159 [Lindgomyces ingoldianus]KAF2463464.1 hypothetical protein BDR25DRAFT_397159 [Lindgomyces ingoldianus]
MLNATKVLRTYIGFALVVVCLFCHSSRSLRDYGANRKPVGELALAPAALAEGRLLVASLPFGHANQRQQILFIEALCVCLICQFTARFQEDNTDYIPAFSVYYPTAISVGDAFLVAMMLVNQHLSLGITMLMIREDGRTASGTPLWVSNFGFKFYCNDWWRPCMNFHTTPEIWLEMTPKHCSEAPKLG